MAKKKPSTTVATFNLGDRVKIRDYAGNPGRIVELRGALGPGGSQIYRVLVQRKPSVVYIEVRGDQLEAFPAATSKTGFIGNKATIKPDISSDATVPTGK